MRGPYDRVLAIGDGVFPLSGSLRISSRPAESATGDTPGYAPAFMQRLKEVRL
jgi:hypothetical protein